MTEEVTAENRPDSRIALGRLIEQERENQQLTIEQVAASLKILPGAVKGIEQGDYSRIRGEVFIRGYIRAYAAHLSLDVDKCLQMYGAATAIKAPLINPIEPPKINQRDGLDAMVKYGLPVVVIIALWLGYKQLYVSDGNVVSTESQIPVVVEEFDIEKSEGIDVTDLNLQKSLVQSIAQNDLVVDFSDTSTISVFDERGEPLIDDQLKRKGDLVELTGSVGYSLLIGYGSHVKVYFRQEPVELNYSIDNPVVRIDLGM